MVLDEQRQIIFWQNSFEKSFNKLTNRLYYSLANFEKIYWILNSFFQKYPKPKLTANSCIRSCFFTFQKALLIFVECKRHHFLPILNQRAREHSQAPGEVPRRLAGVCPQQRVRLRPLFRAQRSQEHFHWGHAQTRHSNWQLFISSGPGKADSDATSSPDPDSIILEKHRTEWRLFERNSKTWLETDRPNPGIRGYTVSARTKAFEDTNL